MRDQRRSARRDNSSSSRTIWRLRDSGIKDLAVPMPMMMTHLR